jgi:hypothetical protein
MAKSALSANIGKSPYLSKSLQLLRHIEEAEEAQGVPLIENRWRASALCAKAKNDLGISLRGSPERISSQQ